ncbi:molybdopterin-guanine dinucleotide biosynthesis protein MobA [Thermococcus profundus]|uniref:Molybdopterin-guanine dinucleotide biosynthesis protein MobA n=1 Tax=Thermococcus profundus TaxID=49899 RepID=A0A2Z2M9H6_THEPR|nr:molybdenum cofactor guanylyltransferase [Thermococcus profundus]ASJ03190.1 molybdopterin-guanine dinucleotide biosynthesis protein MobA [Thermococcus profundus]
MKAFILAYPEKPNENYTIPVGDEPVIRLTERRLLLTKRIDDIVTLVRKDKLKTYSLHVSKPLPASGRNKMEALLNPLRGVEELFLLEGNMPLVMPFFVDYMVGLFYEMEPDALIPVWRDGSTGVTHAIYDSEALLDAIEAALGEGYRSLSKVVEFLDYQPLSIEELSRRNPKVTLSFFRVKNGNDARFAEETLKALGQL